MQKTLSCNHGARNTGRRASQLRALCQLEAKGLNGATGSALRLYLRGAALRAATDRPVLAERPYLPTNKKSQLPLALAIV